MHPTIRILSTFALLVAIPRTGTPAETKALPVSPTIESLVAQLGHKQFRVRQAAGRILEERGEEALPLLRQSMEHPDLEIRRRAEVLSEKIERNLLLNPKRVTVQAVNTPVDEILKDIAKQTGYQLDYQGGPIVPKVTLALKDGTYWEAMQTICSMAGLTYYIDEQQGNVLLFPQNRISPHTFIDGPFRFVASSFNYNRRIDLSNIPRNGLIQDTNESNLTFAFTIQAEPKTALLAISAPVLEKATDENGASLLPRHDESDYIVRYSDATQYRRFQQEASVAMHRNNKDALKAKLIQGKVALTLLSSIRPEIVIDKLAVGMKKPVSAVGATAEVIVEELTEQNKNYSFTMTINRRGPASQADYNFINSIQQKFELQDAKGRKYTCQGMMNVLENDLTHVRGTFLFVPSDADIGKPVKLILNQWLTITHDVNFQFKDLPLP